MRLSRYLPELICLLCYNAPSKETSRFWPAQVIRHAVQMSTSAFSLETHNRAKPAPTSGSPSFFNAVYLVPKSKYPANPPSIGELTAIGIRTGLCFSNIAISIVATLVAFSLRRLLVEQLGYWNVSLFGALAYIVLIAVAQSALPIINEVPKGFLPRSCGISA